jgi:hypothetical protein
LAVAGEFLNVVAGIVVSADDVSRMVFAVEQFCPVVEGKAAGLMNPLQVAKFPSVATDTLLAKEQPVSVLRRQLKNRLHKRLQLQGVWRNQLFGFSLRVGQTSSLTDVFAVKKDRIALKRSRAARGSG